MVSLTVRPWFDMVEDLQAKAFAADTPEQRQQLFFDGKQLQDDGRVLAQLGVVAETTIQLVSQCTSDEKKLDEFRMHCFQFYVVPSCAIMLRFADTHEGHP